MIGSSQNFLRTFKNDHKSLKNSTSLDLIMNKSDFLKSGSNLTFYFYCKIFFIFFPIIIKQPSQIGQIDISKCLIKCSSTSVAAINWVI